MKHTLQLLCKKMNQIVIILCQTGTHNRKGVNKKYKRKRKKMQRTKLIYKEVPTKLDMVAEEERESERGERECFDKENRNRSIFRTIESWPLVPT